MQNGRKASAKGGSRSRIEPVAHKVTVTSSMIIPPKIGDGNCGIGREDFRFEQGQNNYDTNSAFVSLVSFE